MTLKETIEYHIVIDEQYIQALVNFMIQVEKGIDASCLSNHITIDLECKENKELIKQLVNSFNEVKIDKPNIAANPYQTNENV